MTVTYEPPLSRSGAAIGEALLREVIETGPAYTRGPRSTRWHRIRSAQRRLGLDAEIREIYHAWRGQSLFARPDEPVLLFAEKPAVGEPSCGTCEGRAIGADRDRPGWLFSPMRLKPPTRCPGTHTMLVREDQDHGGPYATRFDARAHTPGPRLIPGCPWHAWRELTIATDAEGNQVACCRCQTLERAA